MDNEKYINDEFIFVYSGPPLSVAPLPTKYGQFAGRGDYDEYREVEYRAEKVQYPGEMEDPYARVLYGQERNKRFHNSQSASRLQSHQGRINYLKLCFV